MNTIPIIILSRDRPAQLREMVDSIERRTTPGTYRIIICDNDSTCKTTIDYLHELETRHTVIYNHTNLLFEGFNPGLKEVGGDYFVLSDPDIRLNDDMPVDWPDIMIKCLEHSGVPKIGLALNINYPPSEMADKVAVNEDGYWKAKYKFPFLDDDCYLAPIDTTFAMYRRDTFRFWTPGDVLEFNKARGIVSSGVISQDMYNMKYFGWHKNLRLAYGYPTVIRMASRFTAEHMGWNMENKYTQEIRDYTAACNGLLASSASWMKKHGAI